MEVEENRLNLLSPWDYVIFSLVLVISAGIGIFHGCIKSRQKTNDEFLMAKREMTIFPVALSLLASFMSAITLLGMPAETYVYGTGFWFVCLAFVLMIPTVAHLFLPIFYKLKITTVFEYLEMRFHSRALRVFGTALFIFQSLLYMSVVLYAPSLALNAVTGLNVWISVFSLGLVCTFYTSLGGIKAVIWTDVFQTCIMFAGLLAVLIKGTMEFGGFSRIWEIAEEGMRIDTANWDPNPLVRHTMWSLAFGGCGLWVSIYGVNQAQVQRAMSTPTLRQAQIAMWLNMPCQVLMVSICCFCGLIVYAHYRKCDPLSLKRITAADQLLPLYVVEAVNIPGIPGLFTASVFSGTLSTISSVLNSLAAATFQDLMKISCFPEMSEARGTLVTKILSVVYGGVCIALTFVAANMGSVLGAAVGLFGMISGPLLGLFMLGFLYPCANKKGAFAGVITSLICTIWLGIGAFVYKPAVYKPPVSTECPSSIGDDNYTMTTMSYINMSTPIMTIEPVTPKEYLPGYFRFYEISYMWYAVFAVLVCHIVGIPVSLITGPEKPENLEPGLTLPIFDKFCCCLPAGLRRCLRCNMPEEESEIERKCTDVADASYTNPAIGTILEDFGPTKL